MSISYKKYLVELPTSWAGTKEELSLVGDFLLSLVPEEQIFMVMNKTAKNNNYFAVYYTKSIAEEAVKEFNEWCDIYNLHNNLITIKDLYKS